MHLRGARTPLLVVVLAGLAVTLMALAAVWAIHNGEGSARNTADGRNGLAVAVPTGGEGPTGHAVHPLTLGFTTLPPVTDPAGALWMSRAVAEGGQMVRISVNWSHIAPATPPPGFQPANPASSGYDWTVTDNQVRELTAHGLTPVLDVLWAPAWAEGPRRPHREPPGTWRPDPAQFGAFAAAVARRYDGHYPDPQNPGGDLPRVRYWQAWNEPNLDEYLSPQWTSSGGRWVDTSPMIYRQLLNAFYAAVKRVSPANLVVTAGMSPYGDFSPTFHRPGHQRMPPVRFYRDLFCLRGAPPHATRCPDPAHLDVLDSHIYTLFGPTWHAANPGDVATPDMYKLADALGAAERAHTVLPRGLKRLWVTEISWTSNPPAKFGIPLARDARWYEQAMYVLWRQGVDTVLLLQLQDAPPRTKGPWGGLYFFNGQPKPAATAYRFPFVTQRIDHDHVLVWGRSPGAGTLRIERFHGGHWAVVQTVPVHPRQVFLRTIGLRGAATLRGQVGGQTSLTWRQHQ